MLEFISGAAAIVGILVIISNIRFLQNRSRPFLYVLIEPVSQNGHIGYQYVGYNPDGVRVMRSMETYPTWNDANLARAEFLHAKRASAGTVAQGVVDERGFFWDVEFKTRPA